MSTAASRISSKTYNPCGGRKQGSAYRARLHGRGGGAGRCLLRSVHPARGPQLPDLRPGVPSAVHPRPRPGQEISRTDQRRARAPVAATDARDRQGGTGGRRRQARHTVPDRRLPDRLRHVDQHQRQRGQRGSRLIHPNDHVNLCQSSNDVIPTAIQLSWAVAIADELIPALRGLQKALEAKSKEFWPVVKTGRTHLMDATPIRMGQELKGYAGQVEESIRRARAAVAELTSVPLGGTAVGTGLNAHPRYARLTCARLATATGVPIHETSNHFHAQATLDVPVAAHGALRTIAVSLWKIASDIRLMGTGPVAGLGELRLPETQPGSSIMPGKVNPVIVESMTMVVARVLGNDATVLVAGQAGSLFELNVMMPVAGVAMLESITLLAAATRNFSERCVEGLQATDRGPELVERSPMLAPALNPVIGSDEAGKLAKESMRTGRSIRQLARGRGVNERQLNKVLDLGKMTKPGLEGPGGGG